MIVSQPKVSVIMPVYNAGEYIRPCLDSLISQTLREMEIICVLDCPTDGTDKVVEEYAARDERIVVIRNERNMHIGESRNKGLKVARGEYIGFHDSDDSCEPNMYECLYAATDNGQKKIVITDFLAAEILNPSVSDFCKYHLYQRAFLIPILRYKSTNNANKTIFGHITPNLYSSNLIKENDLLFVDTKKYSIEDFLFNEKFLLNIHDDDEISVKPIHLYHYRNHEKGIHLSETFLDWKHLLPSLQVLHQTIKENKDVDMAFAHSLFYNRMIMQLYTLFIEEVHKEGVIKAYKVFRRSLRENEMVVDVVRNASPNTFAMTLPKRIFSLWVRFIIAVNRR